MMNLDKMIGLTDGISTKADKMRILERSGYARADIARFLGVRYQQVRNTLEGDKRTGYNPEIIPELGGDSPVPIVQASRLREVLLDDGGFALIPPDLVESLGESDEPRLFALSVRGGIFVCTSEGLVTRAEQTF